MGVSGSLRGRGRERERERARGRQRACAHARERVEERKRKSTQEILHGGEREGGRVRRRGGGLGSRPKKMYGERLGDGVEYRLMSPTPRL